jgi:hypothetical protein
LSLLCGAFVLSLSFSLLSSIAFSHSLRDLMYLSLQLSLQESLCSVFQRGCFSSRRGSGVAESSVVSLWCVSSHSRILSSLSCFVLSVVLVICVSLSPFARRRFLCASASPSSFCHFRVLVDRSIPFYSGFSLHVEA